MYYNCSYKKNTRIGKQRKIRPFQRLSHFCSPTRSTFVNNISNGKVLSVKAANIAHPAKNVKLAAQGIRSGGGERCPNEMVVP